jgi:hypothetical protein
LSLIIIFNIINNIIKWWRGSILETSKGALIVEEFDKWKFFSDGSRIFDQDEFIIEDNRLLKRLKVRFKELQKFIRVPTNIANPYIQNDSVPLETKRIASAKYFPEWMYCPNCEAKSEIPLSLRIVCTW